MRTLRHIVDKEIKAKFDKNGMAPGDSLKAIHETLGKEQASFAKGGPYERKLADAIKEADAAVRRMVRDANPEARRRAGQDRRRLRPLQDRAACCGRPREQGRGVQALEYDRSVRTSDRSKDHARYSEGKALQQDLSGAGEARALRHAAGLRHAIPDLARCTRSPTRRRSR
jgi:hypothetical protein